MKTRIIHTTVQYFLRILLNILAGLTFAGKGLKIAGVGISRAAKQSLLAAVPLILFFYLLSRKIKRALFLPFSSAASLRAPRLYALGNRYFVHGLVVLLVLFSSIPALSAADAPPGMFGEGTLLKEIVEDQEFITDEILPSPEALDSYLEARFQNQQVPTSEEEALPLPLTLEEGALLRQEIPGMFARKTRTEIVQYEVEDGDTPWAIAEEFGVSVATVLWANQLSLYSTIRPGQKLTILPVSGVAHTVKNGDTVSAIAKRYGASEDEIKAVNQIEDSVALTLGAAIIIPGGRPYRAPQQAIRRVVASPASSVSPVKSSGNFLWPAPNSRRITQYFRWSHTGLDIGDKRGNPILAAGSGVVEYAGWGAGGWGYTVVIDHGAGLKTRYAHASKILTAVGQQVSQGAEIALVGSTGRSTGPHLHFGVYVNGRAVNPLEYLK